MHPPRRIMLLAEPLAAPSIDCWRNASLPARPTLYSRPSRSPPRPTTRFAMHPVFYKTLNDPDL